MGYLDVDIFDGKGGHIRKCEVNHTVIVSIFFQIYEFWYWVKGNILEEINFQESENRYNIMGLFRCGHI